MVFASLRFASLPCRFPSHPKPPGQKRYRGHDDDGRSNSQFDRLTGQTRATELPPAGSRWGGLFWRLGSRRRPARAWPPNPSPQEVAAEVDRRLADESPTPSSNRSEPDEVFLRRISPIGRQPTADERHPLALDTSPHAGGGRRSTAGPRPFRPQLGPLLGAILYRRVELRPPRLRGRRTTSPSSSIKTPLGRDRPLVHHANGRAGSRATA